MFIARRAGIETQQTVDLGLIENPGGLRWIGALLGFRIPAEADI